ncbi:DUF4259 domain-containing protein [Streptomyces lavendulae]|uniref:DUF4259 domain-containing protein n=1 Tax=Streptomyces lavendulae TaxID=1914 RepID=UPI00332062F7
MGTWGTGPFDSDLAGDFTDGLRGLASQQIISALEEALRRVAESGPRIDSGDEVEAVAAAALVASQIPGSKVVISCEDGPDEPLPQLPAPLRALARLALHRVLGDESELAKGWVDSSDATEWRQEVQLILQALGQRDHSQCTNHAS